MVFRCTSHLFHFVIGFRFSEGLTVVLRCRAEGPVAASQHNPTAFTQCVHAGSAITVSL